MVFITNLLKIALKYKLLKNNLLSIKIINYFRKTLFKTFSKYKK